VQWTIRDGTLVRTETLTASHPVSIRRFWVLFPATGEEVTTRLAADGSRIRRFTGREGTLEVSASSANIPFQESLQATGNSALGKGTRGHIPLILNLQATNLVVKPDAPLSWTISLRPVAEGR